MDISFLILFCNKAEQTVECLKSIEGNKVYLLNNGSDNKSSKIVERYLKGVSNVSYIKSPINLGVSAGRNKLIGECNTEWMFFLDNDITIKEKNWKEIIVKRIEENPSVLAFSPRVFNVHLSKNEDFYAFSVQNKRVSPYVIKKGVSNKISGGACIVNKKIFEENGLYDERFFVGFEDYEFALRGIKSNKPIQSLCVPEITLLHSHKKSTGASDNDYLEQRYSSEKIKESYELIKKIYGWTLYDDGVKWSLNQKESMLMKEERKKRKGIKTEIVLYQDYLHPIGGIETFCYNFCKRLSPFYDIVFLCGGGDTHALNRISEYADVVFYKGQVIDTDIFIYGVAWGNRPTNVKANTCIQMVHGDYEWMQKALNFKYTKIPQVTRHIAVGKYVQEQFKKITGLECDVIYNLLDEKPKEKPFLKLVSVTRIGREKGMERIAIMAKKLEEGGVDYIWHIFGNGSDKSYEDSVKRKLLAYPNILFCGSRIDTSNYVKDADYLVALSDSEGFSYSTYESLQLGTPCIITDYPSGREQITDGVNGYIVKKDLSNLNIQSLLNKKLKGFVFREKSSEEDWKNYLGGYSDKPIKRIKPKLEMFSIEILKNYNDLELFKKVLKGDILKVRRERMLKLVSMGIAKQL